MLKKKNSILYEIDTKDGNKFTVCIVKSGLNQFNAKFQMISGSEKAIKLMVIEILAELEH